MQFVFKIFDFHLSASLLEMSKLSGYFLLKKYKYATNLSKIEKNNSKL